MNNEAILNKLIELGYVTEIRKLESGVGLYKSVTGTSFGGKGFNALDMSSFLLIQRALFDECGKRDIQILIDNNSLSIIPDCDCNCYVNVYVHKGDTSRESFVKAFCKVVGVNNG